MNRWTLGGLRRMSKMTLTVNGRPHDVDVDPATPLLYVLSDDLQLRGPKFGCGLGQCGACTVIVKGQALRSCVTPVVGCGRRGCRHARRARHAREAASHSTGVHRRAGRAVRVLSERRDHDGEGLLDRNPKASDETSSQAMSGVLCRCFAHGRMMRAIKRYAQGVARMTTASTTPRRTTRRSMARRWSRRAFLKGSGALIVSFAAGSRGTWTRSTAVRRRGSTAEAAQLDSWIAIAADGRVTAYTGKCELGQGLFTAQTQLIAEELGVAVRSRDAGSVRHGDDARSGHDVGQPVASDELQPAQPCARCGDGAGGAAAAGVDTTCGVPSSSSSLKDGVISAKADRVEDR